MTNHVQNQGPVAGDRTVYVKTIAISDLPQEVRAQAEGLEQIYAVHNAEGQQLALVGNRTLAFKLARQHDYAPVPVH